ncbi:MAG TPA: hypothetical protein VNO33_24355 [Kofleriaceae bacterium]|nr:hypothetical protein [Kofleriaceae bacterium]
MERRFNEPRESAMKMLKIVRIEYAVRPDVDLDELTGAIGEFVAGIHAHDPGHRYTSYQLREDSRRFVHIGEFDAETLPGLQAEAFFGRFTAFLRERCAAGPEVTALTRVASTR